MAPSSAMRLLAAAVGIAAVTAQLPTFTTISTPADTTSRTQAATFYSEFGNGGAVIVGGRDSDGQTLTTQVTATRTGGQSITVATGAATYTPLAGATFVYVGATGLVGGFVRNDLRTFVLGGRNGTTLTMNVASYDGETGAWRNNVATVATAGQTTPVARTGAAAAYLTRCNMTIPSAPVPCIVMFGGQSSSGLLNDVWALWVTEATPRWQLIQPNTASPQGDQPSGRANAVGAASPDGTTMYVYGGTSATGPTADMFALAPAGFPDATLSEMTNVAIGTRTRESSTLLPWGAGGPGTAVDGNLRTVFEPAPYVCSHTNDELAPWWQTRLNSTMNIDAVRVFPRSDGWGWRNRQWQLYTHTSDPNNGPPPTSVAGTLVTDAMPNLATAPVTVMFSTPRPTLFLWVNLPNLGYVRVLTLCEVEIYVKRTWVWRRLSGTDNVARLKPARQTSVLTDWGGGDPNRAVDGETANNYDATKTCSHTAGIQPGNQQFWQVDLGGVYDIRQIRVWPRTDCCTNRNNEVVVYAGYSRNNYMFDTRCYGPGSINVGQVAASAPDTGVMVPMPCVTKARYVTVTKSPVATALGWDDSIIMLCEVQVLAERLLNAPNVRRDFSALTFRGNLVIYGGRDPNGFSQDDIRFFDMTSRSWQPAIEPLGVGLSGRSFTSLSLISSDHLLFHGGSTNSDVSSEMALLTFPVCPVMDKVTGVGSYTCAAGGTSCVFTCLNGFTDQNRGRPVICHEDGSIEGYLPPCLPDNKGSAPGTVAAVVRPVDNTSVTVTWNIPGSLGYYQAIQGAAANKGFRVRATPREFFEDFALGFISEAAWRVITPDTPSSSFFYFKEGQLYLDAGAGTDTWTNYIVDDVAGNRVNDWAVRNMFVLYRDWPSSIVSPLGEWAIETELDAQAMPGSSMAALGICDTGVQVRSGTPEIQVFLGVRYQDWGENGAPATISFESNGGRTSRSIPALSRHVYLRLERVTSEESDREGQWVWRASYKYDAGARWTRIYTVITRRSILGVGWNTTTNRLQGPGLQASTIRPFIGVKSWNGNEFARALTSFRFLRIRPGLVQARNAPTVSVGPAVTTAVVPGLTRGATYDVSVEMRTDAGWGPRGTTTVNVPAVAASTTVDWGTREVAVGKPAFARPGGLDTYWGGPPSFGNDGNWLGVNDPPGPTQTMFHGSCNMLDWWGVDLGVEYAAIKSIRIRNRCDADWAAFRGRHWSFIMGDDVRGAYTTNQHAPLIGYDRYYYLAANTAGWIFGDWGVFNWPPTTIWNARYDQAQDRLINMAQNWQDPTYCVARIPTPGQGRYFYVQNNVGDCMHFSEINVFASNACPAWNGLGSVSDVSGGQSCDANTRFGVVCEQTCQAPNSIQSGQRKVTCNGEQWTGGFTSRVVCAPTCAEVEPPPYADTMAHEIINEDFVNMGSNNFRTERLSTLNPVFSPLSSVWSFDGTNAQAIGRLGLPEEPSLIFVTDKIRSMDQFSTFTIDTTFATSDRAGILFRVVDQKNLYRAIIDVASGFHYVEAVVNGVPNMIASARMPIAADAITTARVSVSGYNMNLTVNNKLLIITADRQFAQGYAGMYAQSTATFTNFRFVKIARTCAGAQQGERCIVTCQPGLTSRGSPTVRTCQSSGNWDILLSNATQCTLNPPVFPSAVISVRENSARNALVGAPLVAQSSSPVFPVQFQLNQIYAMPSGVPLGNSLFSVDFCTGQVKVRQNNALDFEFVRQYLAEVRVYVLGFTDAFTDRNITVNIIDVDEPPIIIPTTLQYMENTTAGTVIGSIQWWDPENNTVAFTVDIADNRFAVDAAGAVRVVQQPSTELGFPTVHTGMAAPMNFEGGRGNGQISVTARQTVSDLTLAATGTVTLSVQDANDPPYFQPARPYFVVAEATLPGSVSVGSPVIVGTPLVIDEDAGFWNQTALSFSQADPSQCNVTANTDMPTIWTPTATSAPYATPSNRMFDVVPATGEVRMIALPPTAYSAVDGGGNFIWAPFLNQNGFVRAVYTVCVRATDGFSATSRPVQVAIGAYMPTTPIIRGISPSTFPTTGSTIVNITGSGFLVTVNPTVTAWYSNGVSNYTATNCAVQADNSITCRTVPGVGGRMLWTVRLNNRGVISEIDVLASYALPVVTTIVSHTNMSLGGQIVTIYGSNFGTNASAAGALPQITYGPAANPTKYTCPWVTITHTIITCRSSSIGGGRDLVWRMTIGNQVATDQTASLWSYGYPQITSVQSPTGATYSPFGLGTTGGQQLIINGRYLGSNALGGPTLEIRYGGPNGRLLPFVNCVRDTSFPHNIVRCLTSPGVGTGLRLWLAVEGVELETKVFIPPNPENPAVPGLAYLAPRITRMYGPGYDRADTTGGQRIIMEGSGFGPVALMGGVVNPIDSLVYGPSDSNLRYTAIGCRVLIDDRQAECLSAEGVGRGHVYRLTVGGQMINQTGTGGQPNVFGSGSYAPPNVAGFDGDGSRDAFTRGGQSVVITGRNFGPADAYTNALLSVSYGVELQRDIKNSTGSTVIGSVQFRAAACTITVPHTQLTCTTTEGAGAQLAWDVVVASQRSATPTTNYAAPKINTITNKPDGSPVTAASTDGGEWVVLTGAFFGPNDYARGRSLVQAISYGVVGSEYTVPDADWVIISHESIEVRLQPGSGSNLMFRVMVADQMSESDIAARFSYAPPEVLYLDPATATTYSNPKQPTVVTAVTRNLPLLDPQSKITLAFGNVNPRIINAAVPRGVASIAAARNPDGTVNVTFPLPEDGGGVGVGVSMLVTPATSNIVNQQSVVNAANAFKYLNPVISDVIVTKARFAGSNATANSDYPPCPFNTVDWSCSDLSAVYEMVIVGKHLTNAKAAWADSITRNLELLARNETFVGEGEVWSDSVTSADGKVLTSKLLWIASWTHTRVVAYYKRQVRAGTTVVGGTLRMTIGSVAYYGAATQVVVREFAESNPEVDGVVGNERPFPTAGGAVDAPLVLSMTNLQSATDLKAYVGGRAATLVKRVGSVYTPMTTASEIAQWVTQNDPTVTSRPYWEVLVQVPPGQGRNQKVQVFKLLSASDTPTGSNDGFSVDYIAPVINQVQVVRRGVAGAREDVFGFTRVFVPTDGTGGVVRVYGTNLGVEPLVIVGDGPVTIPSSAIRPCTITPAPATHTCYQFTAPAGEGDGFQYRAPGQALSTYEYPNGFYMQLDAGGQATTQIAFRYETPTVTSVVSSTGLYPTRGGMTVTINGDNFGEQKLGRPVSSILVEFGRTTDSAAWVPCADILRISHYVMNCTLPEGSGKQLAVRVTVAGQAGTSLNVFSYNKPVISNVTVVHATSGLVVAPTTLSGFSNPVVQGQTAGGDTIIIAGVNFGKLDAVHCAFFTWSHRLRDTSRVHTCNGWEDFLGEGEISGANVISWSHEEVVLRTPPGIGVKDIELSIRGSTTEIPQGDAALRRFMYSVPVVNGFWLGEPSAQDGVPQGKFDTDGGEVVTAWGENFGPTPVANSSFSSDLFPVTTMPLTVAPSLPTAVVGIVFHRACVSDARTLFGARPTVALPIRTTDGGVFNQDINNCQYTVSKHEHGRLVFQTGSGIGRNRTAYVVVMDGPITLYSNPIYIDYYAPRIDSFQPNTVYMTGELQPVDVFGKYFGNAELADVQGWTAAERAIQTVVGGIEQSCRGEPRRRRESGETIVSCDLEESIMPAGYRNVSLTVAGQNGRKEATELRALLLVCATGYYGRVDETCLPCPAQSDDPGRRGAVCKGYIREVTTFEQRFSYPRPLKGWYNLNSSDMYTLRVDGNPSMLSACPDGFQDNGRDVCIVPCDPPESCLGDNHCAEGYTSKPPYWRCGTCDKGFYRRAGECVKCPDSPAALFIGFILLVIVVAGVGFMLNRKQINIAVLSIGVDFFQVLAIFAQARVKWPPVVKELLHVLSAFNLNIEIVAPECLVPDISYKQKFWFIMILPLCIMGLFGINYLGILFYRAVIQGQPKKMWHTHRPALMSSALVLLYLLYLYLTRTIFDVFNCGPTFPPDGRLYLQVVPYEECGKAGGVQLTLLGYAVAGLIVYTAGYPIFIGYTIFRNREIVMEDQLLRAKGTGNDKLTNPRAYDFRLTYGRSYFQFKPDWCMWILAIILRKFFIAITAVVFGKNSSFQMAACLLIMFLAYAAQVQIRPYMSPGDFEEVLKNHSEASYTSAIHARLRSSIAGIESRGRKKGHKNLINFDGKVDRAAVFGVLTGFFFNYNTVEAIMTFGAVIVCLMAIMYQANELNSYYPESKDSVTSVVLIMVIWCLVYFFAVVITEIVVLYNEDNRTKQLAKAARNARKDGKKGSDEVTDETLKRAARQMNDGDFSVGNVESATNPMFLQQNNSGNANAGISTGDVVATILSQRDAPPTELWRVFQNTFSDLHKANETMREQLAEARKREATGGSTMMEAEGPRGSRAANKQQFAPKSAPGADGVNPMMAGRKPGLSLAAAKKASARTAVSSDE